MNKPSKHVTTNKTVFLKTTRLIWEPGARAGQLISLSLKKKKRKKAIANRFYTYWTVNI